MTPYDPDSPSLDDLSAASTRRLAALRDASALSDKLRRKAALCDDANGAPTSDGADLRGTADLVDDTVVALRRAEWAHLQELERGIPNRDEDRRLHASSLLLAHTVEQLEAVEAEC